MTQPSAPFADFAPRTPLNNPLRAAITAAYRRPEPEALAPLLAQARLPADQAAAAEQLALRIAKALRERIFLHFSQKAMVEGVLAGYRDAFANH